VQSSSGVKKLNPKTYAALVNASGASSCICIADEVLVAETSAKRQRKAIDRSLRWLDSFLSIVDRKLTSVLGVVLAGLDARSAQGTAERDVDGFVISGLCGGESAADFHAFLCATVSTLHQAAPSKPRVVRRVTTPQEAWICVAAGVDLVEVLFPLLAARRGHALILKTQLGKDGSCASLVHREVNLWNRAFRTDTRPLVPGCACPACKDHTRAYVHHLLQTHEILATVLLHMHNLFCTNAWFATMREAIAAGSLARPEA